MLISARKPRRCVAASVFQATDRDDTHAIRTAIGKIAGSGQDHQEGGRVHFIGINFFSHRFQAFRALLNEPVAAELNFNEPVFPVSQMNNGVAFLSVFISVVVNLSVQSIGKNAKISDTKCFKEEAECLQVIDQIVRADA